MTTILVTGATGAVGTALVSGLSAQGQNVRALVHNPDRARQLSGSDAEIVFADYADLPSVRAALDNVDSVFLACGNVPDQVEYECTVIDEAEKVGVERIVKLSARGAAIGSRVAYWDWHGLIERHLQASGVPSVVLQPGFMMTNLLAAADQVRHQGMFFAPAADARIAMIDPHDVAAVAAVALTADGHGGQTYVLTGPEAITYQRVARELSAVTGRSVGYVDIPDEAATAALIEAGLPPFVAQQVVTVFGELRAGVQAAATDTVQALTGQSARSFAAFARGRATAFAGTEVGSSLSA
jgi:uncharacterized protein YbjT (DUF2867 family)